VFALQPQQGLAHRLAADRIALGEFLLALWLVNHFRPFPRAFLIGGGVAFVALMVLATYGCATELRWPHPLAFMVAAVVGLIPQLLFMGGVIGRLFREFAVPLSTAIG